MKYWSDTEYVDTYQRYGSVPRIVIALSDHEQAMAEKDREITHLQDVYTKQRRKQEDAHQQLMEKAVLFAEGVWQFIPRKDARQGREAYEFLHSPEVQAWKEQQK